MTIKRVNHGRYHSYVDTDTGQKIPGVTSILGDGLSKPALINWAANTTAEYAVDRWDELAALSPSKRLKELQGARFADKDAAAGRGTAVHKLAEKLVRGDEVEVPDALRGHVESYIKFLDEWDVQPLWVEGVIVNYRHRYAGTLDLIATCRRPGVGLFDVKTARSGVWPDNALQLSGYRYAEFIRRDNVQPEEPMPAVDWCAVVHVRADGFDVVPVEAGPATFRYFLYCQQMWLWANDASKTVVGEPLAIPQGASA